MAPCTSVLGSRRAGDRRRLCFSRTRTGGSAGVSCRTNGPARVARMEGRRGDHDATRYASAAPPAEFGVGLDVHFVLQYRNDGGDSPDHHAGGFDSGARHRRRLHRGAISHRCARRSARAHVQGKRRRRHQLRRRIRDGGHLPSQVIDVSDWNTKEADATGSSTGRTIARRSACRRALSSSTPDWRGGTRCTSSIVREWQAFLHVTNGACMESTAQIDMTSIADSVLWPVGAVNMNKAYYWNRGTLAHDCRIKSSGSW